MKGYCETQQGYISALLGTVACVFIGFESRRLFFKECSRLGKEFFPLGLECRYGLTIQHRAPSFSSKTGDKAWVTVNCACKISHNYNGDTVEASQYIVVKIEVWGIVILISRPHAL